MQVEHKTEKGTVIFVKVPDDSFLWHIKENSAGYYLQYSCLNEKSQRTIGNSDYFYKHFKLICLTSEVTEDKAKIIVRQQGSKPILYQNYSGHDGLFLSAIDSFKSLMQHLHVHDVNPYHNSASHEFKRSGTKEQNDMFLKWHSAQERTGKWIVLFKPN